MSLRNFAQNLIDDDSLWDECRQVFATVVAIAAVIFAVCAIIFAIALWRA